MGGSSKQGLARAEATQKRHHPDIMKFTITLVILLAVIGLIGKPQPLVDEEPITHLPQVTQKAEALVPEKTSETITPPETVKPPEPPKIPTTPEEQMLAVGISEDQWYAVKFILQKESGWCHLKWETQYGACPTVNSNVFAEDNAGRGYGLCQSTPANKMATAGEDWRTNPVTQLKWCNQYAIQRYGNWHNAYQEWLSKRWW